MSHFEGDKQFRQNPKDLAAKLSDARFLVGCVPDVESITATSTSEATCVLRPGFSFARGTLQVTLRFAQPVLEDAIQIHLHSKGIGSTSEVEALLKIGPTDRGSQVHWSADIKQLGGLLKAVPQGLIQAAARKVIDDAWTAVEKKLHQESGAA
ncbi:MAG: SRPBCC domain-containing protein [Gemmataceae bacterium]